jgi:hypothetical protein
MERLAEAGGPAKEPARACGGVLRPDVYLSIYRAFSYVCLFLRAIHHTLRHTDTQKENVTLSEQQIHAAQASLLHLCQVVGYPYSGYPSRNRGYP